MDEDFRGSMWYQMTGEDETDEDDDDINPCGKPHNNGEDTCQECLTIKEGI